jgi:HD-GYP domain-containing protein (c-di-GMP phosphodiesterase class II)
MRVQKSHLRPETLIAAVAGVAALCILVIAWGGPAARSISGQDVLVAVFLLISLVVTSVYPIHFRYHTKISISTVPTYLIVVLLPPPLAALTAGAGTLATEVLLRKRQGSLLVDIVTSSARWVLVALVSSLIAHLAPGGQPGTSLLLLVGASVTMFIGDWATVSIQISLMCGEPLWHVLETNLKDAGMAEGVQYAIGLLGAFAAFQAIWSIALLILPTIVAYLTFKSLKEMHTDTREMLEGMADMVDLRDPHTGGHSRRVAEWSARILNEMRIVGAEADLIVQSAHVHDIGKIGIPDEVLRKPGQLTLDERTIMESHPRLGADLLTRYPDFARGVEIIRHHHERWDGQGYPDRLAGYDIAFGARVLAVADSVDAMTSDRPYRCANSLEQVIHILQTERDRQWDPDVVDACLRCIASMTKAPLEPAVAQRQAHTISGESYAEASLVS